MKWSGEMSDIEFILSLTPSLIRFKLILSRRKFDSAFDGHFWEQIMETKLTQLRKVEFFFICQYDKYATVPTLDSLITPFRTPFWLIEKFCYFNADHELTNSVSRLYTLPLCTIDPEDEYIKCNLSSKDFVYSLISNLKVNKVDFEQSQVY